MGNLLRTDQWKAKTPQDRSREHSTSKSGFILTSENTIVPYSGTVLEGDLENNIAYSRTDRVWRDIISVVCLLQNLHQSHPLNYTAIADTGHKPSRCIPPPGVSESKYPGVPENRERIYAITWGGEATVTRDRANQSCQKCENTLKTSIEDVSLPWVLKTAGLIKVHVLLNVQEENFSRKQKVCFH